MNIGTKEIRQAFLDGYLDALDVLATPSVDYGGDRARQVAWQAGHDHFHQLVRREQARLEEGVGSGDGFPVNFSSES